VGLIGLFALVWGFTADIRLACGLIGGMGVLMALLALLASVLLRLGSRLKGPMPCAWPSITSPERGSGLFQLAGFALALMLFGLLWAARVDLLEDFSTRLPADAPNRFWSMWRTASGKGSWPICTRPGPSPRTSTPWCAGA
jgi:putative ABC transport system permease protein